ncbi:Phosphate propanoyltransferase [Brevibacillus laterosporus]|nr:Phosphate propanoyltransferase [Brevibacillus laterosporus]
MELIQNQFDQIAEKVVAGIKQKLFIPVEASGRHVHLSRKIIDILFGEGYALTKAKELSQPGQFSCVERVDLIGPKGTIKNVAVLGPERQNTQVEVSLTDAVALGIRPPLRESGNLAESAEITLATQLASIPVKAAIIAKRHIHMSAEDAQWFGLSDKQNVCVEVLGTRPVIFQDVTIRVSPHFRTFMHLDFDEANACGYHKGTVARLVRK